MLNIILIILITGIGIYTIYSLTNNTTPRSIPLELFYTNINDNDMIQLPIRDITSAITIDWGDTKIETFDTNNPSHTYKLTTSSDITIKVSGGSFNTFGNFTNNLLININKLKKVNSWGNYMFNSMYRAFFGATNLIYVPNTIPSSVKSMYDIFRGATNFNGDISNWDTSNVENMSGMFYGAKEFKGNISNWNTRSVTDMISMFYDAKEFNGDISKWNTSNVKNMSYMFSGASKFNQDINTKIIDDKTYWDTRKVTDMSFMFYNATNFNQNIGGWNISKVTNITSMFNGNNNDNRPKLSVENYTKLIIGWATTAQINSNLTLSLNVITNRDNGSAQLYNSAESAYNTLRQKGWTFNPFSFIPDLPNNEFTNVEKMSNYMKINGFSNSKLLISAKYIK